MMFLKPHCTVQDIVAEPVMRVDRLNGSGLDILYTVWASEGLVIKQSYYDKHGPL